MKLISPSIRQKPADIGNSVLGSQKVGNSAKLPSNSALGPVLNKYNNIISQVWVCVCVIIISVFIFADIHSLFNWAFVTIRWLRSMKIPIHLKTT